MNVAVNLLPVATIAVRIWSSSSLWLLYHTACGTYTMVKYIYTIGNEYISEPDYTILYGHVTEKCGISGEKDYDLIVSNETLITDLAKLHEQVFFIEAQHEENDCKHETKHNPFKKSI